MVTLTGLLNISVLLVIFFLNPAHQAMTSMRVMPQSHHQMALKHATCLSARLEGAAWTG